MDTEGHVASQIIYQSAPAPQCITRGAAFAENCSTLLNTGVVSVYVRAWEPGEQDFDRQCLFPKDMVF